MARQNSKYFSSVIEKLIADKHKENIVVDDSFKMSLREKVVERAGMMPQMEVSDSAETGGFAGFVNRWKYALALVPSALLVMVVAAQVMNMPVAVESDVMGEGGGVLTTEQNATGTLVLQGEGQEETDTLVLQGDGQEESHTLEELRTSKAESNNVGGGQTKKIKTFPGALVMPVEGGGDGEVTTLQSATGTSEELRASEAESNNDGVVDTSVLQGGVQEESHTSVLQGGVQEESHTSVLQGGVQSETGTSEELRASEAETNSVGGVGTSEVENSDGGGVVSDYAPTAFTAGVVLTPVAYVPDRTGSLDTNDYYESSYSVTSSERTESYVRNDDSLVVADKGDSLVAAPSGDGMGGGTDDSSTPTNDYATRKLVNPSLAVPLVMKNAELPVFNVSYETSLSSTEKAALEINAILPLTEGRDVQRVVVGRDANGYLAVTVFYGDGSSASSTYSFNSARGVWDKVTYVQPVSTISEFTYKTYKINY